MKIIFLDIDGVLVTRRLGVFEDNLLQNLKRVCAETDAIIVLSSDWRRHPQARMEAKRFLAMVGLNFIACTPSLSAYIAQRPTEIMQWKKDYQKRADAEPITHWLAIDDRPLLEERHGTYLRGHFVHTHPLRGLTEAVADDMIGMLNQDVPEPARGPAQTRASYPGTEAAAEASDSLALPMRIGNSPGGRLKGGASARHSSVPSQSKGVTAGLGQGMPSFGLSNLGGDNLSLTDTNPPPAAGMPTMGRPGRQRGHSVGAPSMGGLRR